MITPATFDRLSNMKGKPMVSIYQCTSEVGREREDRITFGNLLKDAEAQLKNHFALNQQQIDELMVPAYELQNDTSFWAQQGDGLAVFLAPDLFEHHHLELGVVNATFVNGHFVTIPLIPSIDGREEFYLLTLSRNTTKLFLVDRKQIRAIDTTGILPNDIDTALLLDAPDEQIARREEVIASLGYGDDKDDEDGRLRKYMTIIDRGVRTLLMNENRPLILAGVEELIPVYNSANKYNHLIPDVYIRGNVDETPSHELHRQAWQAMGDRLTYQRDRDYEIYSVNSARGETTDNLAQIVPAAVNGRIAVLWVAADTEQYGRYIPETNGVELTDPSEGAELHNLAAVSARQSGARVYVVPPNDLPSGDSDVCAILRYSVGAPLTNLN